MLAQPIGSTGAPTSPREPWRGSSRRSILQRTRHTSRRRRPRWERLYLDRGLTGTYRRRPGLDQALAAVRSVARGVKLSLGGTSYDPSDPMGKMFFNILPPFAGFEVDLLPMRTREGMAVAAGHPRRAQLGAGAVRQTTEDRRGGLPGKRGLGRLPLVFRRAQPGPVSEAAGVSAPAAAGNGDAAPDGRAVDRPDRRRDRIGAAAGRAALGRVGSGRLLRRGSAPVSVSGPAAVRPGGRRSVLRPPIRDAPAGRAVDPDPAARSGPAGGGGRPPRP